MEVKVQINIELEEDLYTDLLLHIKEWSDKHSKRFYHNSCKEAFEEGLSEEINVKRTDGRLRIQE